MVVRVLSVPLTIEGYMVELSKLNETMLQLELAVGESLMSVSTIPDGEISQLLKAFGELHDNRKKLKAILELLDSAYNKMSEQTLPELLKQHDIQSLKVGGKNFILSVRLNASIPISKSAEGFAWLRSVGCSELISERVNAKQLSSFVSDYFEEHAKLPPPEAVTVHMQEHIAVRKA